MFARLVPRWVRRYRARNGALRAEVYKLRLDLRHQRTLLRLEAKERRRGDLGLKFKDPAPV